MDVLFTIFSSKVEKVLDKCKNLHLMDEKDRRNFYFVDVDYKPNIKSVIIKEAELSK